MILHTYILINNATSNLISKICRDNRIIDVRRARTKQDKPRQRTYISGATREQSNNDELR